MGARSLTHCTLAGSCSRGVNSTHHIWACLPSGRAGRPDLDAMGVLTVGQHRLCCVKCRHGCDGGRHGPVGRNGGNRWHWGAPRRWRLPPRTFRVRDIGMRLPVTESRTIRALTTITELGDWLNLSHKGVAELCRFSLRASRYWGSGQTENPRPTTVRHLYDVHSFVESLVR